MQTPPFWAGLHSASCENVVWNGPELIRLLYLWWKFFTLIPARLAQLLSELERSWQKHSSSVFSGIMLYVSAVFDTQTTKLNQEIPSKSISPIESETTAVTECSEQTADNSVSPPTCCLYTHTPLKKHTLSNIHACRHTLVISEPRLLSANVSALSKLF